jgi:uncharacterized protein
MRYTWREEKRKANRKDHELDFVNAEKVFEGLTFTYEDDRLAYYKQRLITLGLLDGIAVSIAHTESNEVIHVLSFRRATNHETTIFFEKIGDQLPAPPVDKRPGHSPDRRTSRSEPKAHRARHRAKRTKGRPA